MAFTKFKHQDVGRKKEKESSTSCGLQHSPFSRMISNTILLFILLSSFSLCHLLWILNFQHQRTVTNSSEGFSYLKVKMGPTYFEWRGMGIKRSRRSHMVVWLLRCDRGGLIAQIILIGINPALGRSWLDVEPMPNIDFWRLIYWQGLLPEWFWGLPCQCSMVGRRKVPINLYSSWWLLLVCPSLETLETKEVNL